MDLLRPFPGSNGWRLPAALTLFLALIPYLHAQQIPVSLESKGPGKEITIRADSQEKDKDIYHLRGHVHMVYEEMRVTRGRSFLRRRIGRSDRARPRGL